MEGSSRINVVLDDDAVVEVVEVVVGVVEMRVGT